MFDALFARATDAIFLADDEGRYLLVNPAAEKLTGYSGEELRTMTVFDLTPPQHKEAGQAMWRKFLRTGTGSGDYTLTRKDGALVEVEFQAVASIVPGTHLSILHDVTARKRDEQRLRRAARLQEATAAMSAAVDTEQVAQAILAAGLSALEAQAGTLIVVVDGGRSAEVVAASGMGPDREEQWAEAFRAVGFPPIIVGGRYRFSLEVPTYLVEVFRRAEAIRVEPVVDVVHPGVRRSFADLGASMTCIPLVVSGALIGGFYLFWKEKRAFCEDEAAFAETLAGLCAQALERARLFTAEREARERAVASERAILEHQDRLQRMAFDRVVVEERERRRVATALHDGVTQYLALAKITLDPIRQALAEADRTRMDAALKLITEAIAETRSVSFELSPPLLYDLGFKAALSWLGEKLEQGSGLKISIADDATDPALDDVTALIVFRTVRELLVNVVKHANSPTASVSIYRRPDHVEVIVEDRGTGFDPAEMAPLTGFGLVSVREQIGRLGGTVEVTSARNEGTRVRVRIPYRSPRDDCSA
jgi:PAS domain S-box-containing protein